MDWKFQSFGNLRSVEVELTLHLTLVLTEKQTNGVLPLQGLAEGKGRTSHWYSPTAPNPPYQATQTDANPAWG